MDNKKLIDNGNRYITEEKYFQGYVCLIDILGFKRYVLQDSFTTYQTIKKLFNECLLVAIDIDANYDEKFCFLSDSILITIKNEDILDLNSQIKSLISLCCNFREIVFKHLQLDVRVGITYGQYMQSGPSNVVIFGPAIIRAHQLAERINEIPDSEIPRTIKYGRSASIMIDKRVFQSDPGNILIDDYVIKHVVLKTGYVLVNPFSESLDLIKDKISWCKDYLRFWKAYDRKYRNKYKNAKNFALLTLCNTEKRKKRLFGKEVCITKEDLIVLHKNIKDVF